VLGTDGLFDNLTEKQIIDEISKLKVNKVSCISVTTSVTTGGNLN
jgi:serine/threonine protein phosphatase PrpC